MLSYSTILRQSYNITIRHPALWLFGLFVAGGFNLNFLQFQDVPARHIREYASVNELAGFFSSHPATLATFSISILIFSILGLVVTNWCRVMLVLLVEGILKTKFIEVREQMAKSKYALVPIIKLSLGTTTLIVIAALGLFTPAFFLSSNPQIQAFLWVAAAALFLPVLFALSCVNIFTTYFIILHKQKLSTALNLATDFFVSRWVQILGLTLLLMALYTACFFMGVSLIYLVKLLFRAIFEQFTNLEVSAIILISNLVSNILIWLLLAILNVFINTALLLLFLQLNTPVEYEEKVVRQVPVVSPAG